MKNDSNHQSLTLEVTGRIIDTLRDRFEKNMNRHKDLVWEKILAKLERNPEKLWSLNQMEETLGEPDVVAYDKEHNLYVFMDCSVETPKNRRSLCFDDDALESRKEHKPKDSATNLASVMGIKLLSESDYYFLQTLGKFDLKTSSWLETPNEIREKGGALFGDNRFGRVFTYHNGAESYYGVRGFRGLLKV